jgi:hypothetical protein
MTETFPHGAFLVTQEGRLSPLDPARPPEIRFAWRGRDCEARLEGEAMHLAVTAGRVPFTIEVGPARAGVYEALRGLRAEMPPGWALSVTPENRLRLETMAPSDATAVSMLRELVRFALALDPYLDRLEEAGAPAA